MPLYCILSPELLCVVGPPDQSLAVQFGYTFTPSQLRFPPGTAVGVIVGVGVGAAVGTGVGTGVLVGATVGTGVGTGVGFPPLTMPPFPP